MNMNSIPLAWRNIRKRNLLVGTIGVIESYTKVYDAQDNLKKEAPYIIALVKLGNGQKIITQIVDCEDVSMGMKVESCLRRAYTDGNDGIINYGLKFRVI